MDQRLLSYIATQRANGYSDYQIATVLKQQGYPETLINASLSTPNQQGKQDISIIKGYVAQYLRQGYTLLQVQQWLKQQGYSEKIISSIMKDFSPHRSSINHSSSLIIFSLLAIIVLMGGYMIILNNHSSKLPTNPITKSKTVDLSRISTNVVAVASKNPDAAMLLCDNVLDDEKERCLFIVSQQSNDPAFCERLTTPSLKDTCYMKFVYEGIYEYCSKLQLISNIEYCDTVTSLKTNENV